MASKVQVQVSGGSIQTKKAETVADLKSELGVESYQASVNGEPQEDDYELADYEFVSLTPAVKGGM